MTRWLFLLSVGCGGSAAKPAPPAPSSPPPAEAPAPSCRETITQSAKRFGMGENQKGSIEYCERQQWSADVRRCMANATAPQQLGECYKMLPPASTQEIDKLSLDSESAVRQLEVYADQMCACPDFTCAKGVMSKAAPFAQGLPPILPTHQARFGAAGERFKSCAKPYLGK